MDSTTSFTIVVVATLAVIAVSVWSANRPKTSDKAVRDLVELVERCAAGRVQVDALRGEIADLRRDIAADRERQP